MFKVGIEHPIIDEHGYFNFTWPDVLSEFDFLIATAIKPERSQYPTPEEIAHNVNTTNPEGSYFNNNIKEGITTFQDVEIETHLSRKN